MADSEVKLYETPSGLIKAYKSRGDKLIRALGVPYALAPRFEPPTPYPNFTEPFDGREPCVAVPQVQDELSESILGGDLLVGLKQEELNYVALSITLPSGADGGEASSGTGGAKIPVMVWIHGGANITGAPDATIYDCAKLVTQNGIIVVKVTYRLGLFGYMADGKARAANLGLLDQLEALRWVQKNVAAFGGDPRNVTVAGQSAGGDAVVHLMACEEAPQLFQRAIIQSPPLGLRPGRDKMNAAMIKQTKDVSKDTSTDDIVEATKGVVKRAPVYGNVGNMPFAPQYGFAPLPKEQELEAAWKRNAAKIDVFIGNCRDEVSPFQDVIPGLKFVLNLPLVGNSIKAYVVRRYTRLVYEDEVKRVADVMAQAGGNVWLYSLSWGPTSKYGSAHAIELNLLFGNEEIWRKSAYIAGVPWTDIEPVAEKLRDLWGQFVKGLDVPAKDSIPGLIAYQKLIKN